MTDSLEGIRRLRGVTWEWRPGGPIDRPGREGGVIAQEVEAVFPELVSRMPVGYLAVDYAGLAHRLAEAMIALAERVDSCERLTERSYSVSDDDTKQRIEGEHNPSAAEDPVATALTNLRAGELRRIDQTALVGTLVESVKDLDRRLERIEHRIGADRGGEAG